MRLEARNVERLDKVKVRGVHDVGLVGEGRRPSKRQAVWWSVRKLQGAIGREERWRVGTEKVRWSPVLHRNEAADVALATKTPPQTNGGHDLLQWPFLHLSSSGDISTVTPLLRRQVRCLDGEVAVAPADELAGAGKPSRRPSLGGAVDCEFGRLRWRLAWSSKPHKSGARSESTTSPADNSTVDAPDPMRVVGIE